MNNKINILLIEDNPADISLLSMYLQAAFPDTHSLVIAETLVEGMKFKKTCDVILSDLSLPDSQGMNTFIKLYYANPTTPIIVLTGYGDEAFAINAVKEGAADFLNKNEMNSYLLKRSITYSIERYKLLDKLITYTKKLEVSEKQLAAAQHYAKMGNWVWDLEKNILEWSDELYRIYGFEPHQVRVSYELFLQLIHPQDVESVKFNMAERLLNHKKFDYYFRIILNDGTIKTIHGIGEVFVNKKGNVIRMSGIDHDITDILLRQEFEALAMAATQSFNSVIITDKAGKIKWVNEGFGKLTEYSLDDVKDTYAEVLNPETLSGLNPESDHYRKLIKTRGSVSYENRNYTRTGKEYWALTTLSPVFDNKGNLDKIIAIDSDISLRKQIEEDMITANKIAEHSIQKGNKALNELIIEKNIAVQATKKAEAATKLKDVFLANMSHEIRTPMNAIMGFSDILSKRELGEEENKYIKIIKSAGENLLAIIGDILDISKIEAGMMTFEADTFSIKETFKSLNIMLMVKAKEKNLDLSFIYDEDIPDILLGDHTRFSQIVINITGNAIKFTKKGSVRVYAKIIEQKNDFYIMEFSITDTGIGISPDNLERIFDRFRQAETRTARIYGGTGLGLSIAKQLVELQGGTLSVKSELGIGSEFTFRIPFKKASQNDVKSKKVENTYNLEDLARLKILLVEDNPLNVMLIKSLFVENKLQVQTAENGTVCIEKLKENNLDITLMDMEMPIMNGYEATFFIRKEMKNNIPIIAMTANAMAGEREKCLNLGMNDYISKPVNATQLLEKIYKLTINS